jgi:hypothetical protein
MSYGDLPELIGHHGKSHGNSCRHGETAGHVKEQACSVTALPH